MGWFWVFPSKNPSWKLKKLSHHRIVEKSQFKVDLMEWSCKINHITISIVTNMEEIPYKSIKLQHGLIISDALIGRTSTNWQKIQFQNESIILELIFTLHIYRLQWISTNYISTLRCPASLSTTLWSEKERYSICDPRIKSTRSFRYSWFISFVSLFTIPCSPSGYSLIKKWLRLFSF